MNARTCAVWVGGALALAGCSGASSPSGGPGGEVIDASEAQALTVSYRSHVRLPQNGSVLDADGFASQLRARDPIVSLRCAPDGSAEYRDVASYLGGLEWSHPVSIVKDASYPPLLDGKRDTRSVNAPSAGAASAGGAAPVIERPDLVGMSGGIGVFLSKPHGLFAVDAHGGAPVVSCALKVPGEPRNFLFKGNELVVIVNARGGGNRSALLRYAVEGASFRFIDAVKLDDQEIVDARLFDSTIVAFTSWGKPRAPSMPTTPSPTGGMAPAGGVSTGVAPAYGGNGDHLGGKIIVVQWDDHLGVDWQDSLLDDPKKQDPTEGSAPGTKYTPNEVVATNKTFASFVAASDRYVAVPRVVQTTRFVQYQTTSYQVCTNYNPQYEQITVCSVSYEQRANPDYQPPNPLTGDYACNGKTLADCIQVAAPVVTQYIYVPVGQTCTPVWQGRCEGYTTKTDTYPTFKVDTQTELSIYRFEGGTFTKLDSTLAKMVKKADAISFETNPLAVTGTVTARDQIQFQNGHLYVFADGALQTLAVAGNSISYLDRLDVAASTDNGAAIVFSDDRAMISARDNSSPSSSKVAMLDLTTPSQPKALTSFSMPGVTTQLILAPGGILGPGQVSLPNPPNSRTLEKLTLFSKEAGTELDNLLLGTEYDALDTSWFDQSDDQRIRLGGARLFLPYSGRRHSDPSEPTAHRLNITRIDPNHLVSEHSFNVSDDIVRTASVDDSRSLAFANSAVYLVDRTSGDWVLSTLKEIYIPFASYRLDDADRYAVVSRVGSSCRVAIHAGDAKIFDEPPLAQADVPCSESATPTGFHSSLLFADTHTGVRIAVDGRSIELLSPSDVDAFAKQQAHGYCRTSDKESGWAVDYLDTVPAQIVCDTTP
jgi:hypothetical protein